MYFGKDNLEEKKIWRKKKFEKKILKTKNFWKKILKKKKKSSKNFDFDIFQFFLVPMGSGVPGIDTSNN